MKVLLFKKQNIKSKAGAEYVKVPALAENGEMIEIFSTKEAFDGFHVPADRFLTDEDTKTLFAEYATTEVNFNHRGRLNSIS